MDTLSGPRLNLRGKPGKVVLMAAICKLILILNAVTRDQAPWQEDPVSTVTEA